VTRRAQLEPTYLPPVRRCEWVKTIDPEDPARFEWVLIPGCPPRCDHPEKECTCDAHTDNECVREANALAEKWHRKYVAARTQLAANLIRHFIRYRMCRTHGHQHTVGCPGCAKRELAAELDRILRIYEPHPLYPPRDGDSS
jgi:hypothetical protein